MTIPANRLDRRTSNGARVTLAEPRRATAPPVKPRYRGSRSAGSAAPPR